MKDTRWVLTGMLLLLLVVLLTAVSTIAQAAPVAQATGPGGEVITITDEPCKLTHLVSGLGNRATWKDGGKTYEGCAGAHPAGVIVLYFREDKSIALVPARLFQPLRSM